ncbi:TetR/AcrR family transcriptional regulator [Romboutsia ilealis]|nr:TetR/AcrR family transcriptional regulator [Romboutsia ilealis]
MKQNNMKETILSAATDLIIKQGIKNTSLADIAKATNISKGTLYYHYSSKNDLICAIADMHLEAITKSVLDCVYGIGTDDDSVNMVNLIM